MEKAEIFEVSELVVIDMPEVYKRLEAEQHEEEEKEKEELERKQYEMLKEKFGNV